MKQFTIREMQRLLADNGYTKVRQRSSHQVWKRSDGDTVTLPVATLKSVVALRLIKEHRLQIA